MFTNDDGSEWCGIILSISKKENFSKNFYDYIKDFNTGYRDISRKDGKHKNKKMYENQSVNGSM